MLKFIHEKVFVVLDWGYGNNGYIFVSHDLWRTCHEDFIIKNLIN